MVTVNLEQFREAVEQWKMLAQVGEVVEAMPVAFRKKPDEYTARIAEADRLLSIIDSAGKVESKVLARGWFHRLPDGDYDFHDEASGAGNDCSECVRCVIVRDNSTLVQQPAADTYPERWRLNDRELNAARLNALHRGLELARKWSAGTGVRGDSDRMVRSMADELRVALSSQDGDYAQQPAPVVDDAAH